MEPRERLREELSRQTEKLARLERERAETEAHITALRRDLAAHDPPTVPEPQPEHGAPSPGTPRTSAEKVKLFRELFRGRPNVYPTRFVSKKTGKAGYAPACSNKFVPGVCELPRIKCGDCTKQAFKPVDDAAVLAHLGSTVLRTYRIWGAH